MTSVNRVAARYFFSSFREDLSLNIQARGKGDLGPISGEGGDFSYVVAPDKFVLTHSSKSRMVSTSTASAWKLYQLLSKTPHVLSLVGWADVPGLLDRASIKYKVYGETAVPWDEFNTELAKLCLNLKKDTGAIKVRQTGSKTEKRKIVVEWPNSGITILLGPGYFTFEDAKTLGDALEGAPVELEEAPF